MDRPRLYVDFNEMLESDLVLLSKHDTSVDSSGAVIALHEGLQVYVYMDDLDANDAPDPLIAEGIVEKAHGIGWAPTGMWCCRISRDGIMQASDRTR